MRTRHPRLALNRSLLVHCLLLMWAISMVLRIGDVLWMMNRWLLIVS